MDEETKNLFRLSEKMQDRILDELESNRTDLTDLKGHTCTCEEKVDQIEDAHKEIQKVTKELSLWRAKVMGAIAVAVAVWEVIKVKLGI